MPEKYQSNSYLYPTEEREPPSPTEKILQLQSKSPPKNIDAERAVLGSILLYNQTLHYVISELQPEDFYLERHQLIYRAMLELERDGKPIDPISIANLLQVKNSLEKAGGHSYLAELADYVPAVSNLEYYTRIVREKAIVRKLIEVGTEIVSEAYSDVEDVFSFLDTAERRIFDIRQARSKTELSHVKDIVSETFNTIEKLYHRREHITGVPTGFDEFDRMTCGLQRGDMIILAGRPSMGKTSLALNMATNAALYHGATVAVFSLEMSKEQLVFRILCSQSRVDASRLRTGQINEGDVARLTRAATELAQAKLFIDDTADISPLEMRAKCRRLKMEYQSLDLIIIDYLQLMRSDNTHFGSREREIAEISRSLKAMAKELDVAVIALSQLNRSLERRPDKRPIMSDLRESGSLEQDADLILFVYRDEVYNEDTEDKGIAELIVAKQRNGPIGTVRLRFFREFTRFDNIAPDSSNQYASSSL